MKDLGKLEQRNLGGDWKDMMREPEEKPGGTLAEWTKQPQLVPLNPVFINSVKGGG